MSFILKLILIDKFKYFGFCLCNVFFYIEVMVIGICYLVVYCKRKKLSLLLLDCLR